MNTIRKLIAAVRGNNVDRRAATDRQAVIDLTGIAAVTRALRLAAEDRQTTISQTGLRAVARALD